jgi:hypothetical protein
MLARVPEQCASDDMCKVISWRGMIMYEVIQRRSYRPPLTSLLLVPSSAFDSRSASLSLDLRACSTCGHKIHHTCRTKDMAGVQARCSTQWQILQDYFSVRVLKALHHGCVLMLT